MSIAAPTGPADSAGTIVTTPYGRTREPVHGPSQVTSNEGGFEEFLDIINPLQHIPVVSTLYQKLTGDTASQSSQIVGSTLFGGIFGLASSMIATVMKQETGKNAGEHVLAFLGADSAEPVQTAAIETPPPLPETQEDPNLTHNAAPTPAITTAPLEDAPAQHHFEPVMATINTAPRLASHQTDPNLPWLKPSQSISKPALSWPAFTRNNTTQTLPDLPGLAAVTALPESLNAPLEPLSTKAAARPGDLFRSYQVESIAQEHRLPHTDLRS